MTEEPTTTFTTLREKMEHDLKNAQEQAERLSLYLAHGNQELLNVPVKYAGYYLSRPLEGQVVPQLSYYPNLDRYKHERLFRPVATTILRILDKDKVIATRSTMDPRSVRQDFGISEDGTRVCLVWSTEDPPCHKVVVQRTVEVEWCGDGPAPLQDGDVVLRKEDAHG